jgi:hypothetical protein
MANGHGGHREGSGRKPRRVRYETEIGSVEELFAGELHRCAASYLDLAQGRCLIVRRTFKPACMIFFEDVETDGETGRLTKVKRRAFPDMGDHDLVLISEVRETGHPDRGALKDIHDRYLGRAAIAPDEADPEAGDAELRPALERAIDLMADGEERSDTFDPDAPADADDRPAGDGPGPLPATP